MCIAVEADASGIQKHNQRSLCDLDEHCFRSIMSLSLACYCGHQSVGLGKGDHRTGFMLRTNLALWAAAVCTSRTAPTTLPQPRRDAVPSSPVASVAAIDVSSAQRQLGSRIYAIYAGWR